MCGEGSRWGQEVLRVPTFALVLIPGAVEEVGACALVEWEGDKVCMLLRVAATAEWFARIVYVCTQTRRGIVKLFISTLLTSLACAQGTRQSRGVSVPRLFSRNVW